VVEQGRGRGVLNVSELCGTWTLTEIVPQLVKSFFHFVEPMLTAAHHVSLFWIILKRKKSAHCHLTFKLRFNIIPPSVPIEVPRYVSYSRCMLCASHYPYLDYPNSLPSLHKSWPQTPQWQIILSPHSGCSGIIQWSCWRCVEARRLSCISWKESFSLCTPWRRM